MPSAPANSNGERQPLLSPSHSNKNTSTQVLSPNKEITAERRDSDRSILFSPSLNEAEREALIEQKEYERRRRDEQSRRRSSNVVDVSEATESVKEAQESSNAFVISFVLMVVVGLGNKIFNKLETIPMHNYPFFISLYTVFIYVPVSFAYIIPMIMFGNQITKEERQIPQKTFFVMGALDSISSTMMTFATNSLDGSLVIMLQQVAIPVSMILSYFLMGAKYNRFHILGACTVIIGLLVVLLPQFFGSGASMSLAQLGWVFVMVFACIPMTLSSVYKEEALGDQEIDPIYLNGWVAVWQLLVGLPLAIPAAYTVPGGSITKIPDMLAGGLKCYLGINSIYEASEGVTVDDCGMAPLYVNIYCVLNLGYNILMILILKYGNANLLWLAMALMVPMGSAAFAMPFMPGYKPLGVNGYIGLFVIVSGLAMYRFSHLFTSLFNRMLGVTKLPITTDKIKKRGINHLLHQRGDFMDVTQFIWEDYSYSVEEQLRDLKKDTESIRSGYLGRLGIRSPSIGNSPLLDGGSYSSLSQGQSYVTNTL
ncbi:hypothetical protein SARC_05195 [Sphaeroforma arctica JP610]|uniref:EamA domain-containing protein n=1 Tax=Sphaeroforma arctica JP610 TaxID=667725 RepID=A0A0L0G079_9EUKA|nr:hypothetical protein SARC_05195 [Sphaeroforma arctica JP610]KNC82522.1 hypothetical protein SARC_05195 [Sphaeroforma arctica JP610]|eukprot:XP_014156424.1 hypothetical protein SARC_05195 [Sphaeroforma arctica JP610]